MADLGNGGSPKVMTAKEVSQYLRIPLSSLWNLTKKGKIRGVKVGKHWRYLESDIEVFLQANASCSGGENGALKISERRRHPRLNCDLPTELTILLLEKLRFKKAGMIRNLGEGGALFICKRGDEVLDPERMWLCELATGDPVKIIFQIPENGSEQLELKGRIVHQNLNSESVVGIKFRDIPENNLKAIRDYVG